MKKGTKNAQKSAKKGSFLTLFFHSILKIVFFDTIITFWNQGQIPFGRVKKGWFLGSKNTTFLAQNRSFFRPQNHFFFRISNRFAHKSPLLKPYFFQLFSEHFFQKLKNFSFCSSPGSFRVRCSSAADGLSKSRTKNGPKMDKS